MISNRACSIGLTIQATFLANKSQIVVDIEFEVIDIAANGGYYNDWSFLDKLDSFHPFYLIIADTHLALHLFSTAHLDFRCFWITPHQLRNFCALSAILRYHRDLAGICKMLMLGTDSEILDCSYNYDALTKTELPVHQKLIDILFHQRGFCSIEKRRG